ncbi:cation-translocating P-type ATPase [Flavobacterium cerinum]|uniref:Cation-translocating P-type ATPase n=1 Tax=Flavobacterium cerinum TaxID=2502784 RepID=A0ABY5IQI7_9FLAO|nr:cation-translocating P-type ATPase [Flavobacterium cerinum]UUC45106.1 cation-translocating P-type ATPase [Flavobacterium cerinum]
MQDIKGLTAKEVLESRKKYGKNQVDYKKENGFWKAVKSLVQEPMVLLLLVAALLYFISGDTGDGIFLASAIVLVAAISLYQDSRSRNALEKLKAYTEPECTVIRNGITKKIKSEELVIGDSLVAEEGTAIAADAKIIQSNDFSVNESILTGESLPVAKDAESSDSYLYQGTTVASGLAIATVTAIGNKTKLGQIGKSLDSIKEEKTPLERQIGNFVKKMVIIGAIVFLIVWLLNYYQSGELLDSLLKALTLAMSILPEEIPVAFTTFMALGAWRLMRLGILVKQMKTVETLGSATVICTDKTGTLTENKMSLAKIYNFETDSISDYTEASANGNATIIRMAMWASEPIPFDPMETAIHEAYRQTHVDDERPGYKIVHEYPLGGKPPMMTHIFENSAGNRIIAAKGAPEAFLNSISFSEDQKNSINSAIKQLASDGYRILGVAESRFEGDHYPKQQQNFDFTFKGIVAFYDPPKKNITSVLQEFYKAGITVKIVTGDNAETTAAIARQIQFVGSEKSLNGDELIQMDQQELQQRVRDTHVFTRMYPEAKLKIINALKAQNEIVAMTGDGVNDGPALKAAHIGIAMGKKGTEIAKQAASLILLEDDLSKMVTAIAMGRRIYTNLKKAIQYIISIHIPIILTVFLPLALGWIYPNIFSPVHVIFLELIMGPTCSIIYENEPMETNTMNEKPRPFSNTFFNWKELTTSIIQGLAITAGTLGIYQYAVYHDYNENTTRTLVFTTLIIANIFLTLVNRSFYYSVIKTLRYKNSMITSIIGITLLLLGLLLFVPPLTAFFEFETLSLQSLVTSILIGFISVIWYEIIKAFKRLNHQSYKWLKRQI